MARRYELKRRAEMQEETRRRIVQAALDLHRMLGPAATSLAAVAERAGVQRHTLYRHFPSASLLFGACRDHFLAINPPPDVRAWRDIQDPAVRIRAGLCELYRYYDKHSEMIGNVLRDADRVPVGAGFLQLQERAADAIVSGLRGSRLRAAALLATDFFTWRLLVHRTAMTERRAVELMARIIEVAARVRE